MKKNKLIGIASSIVLATTLLLGASRKNETISSQVFSSTEEVVDCNRYFDDKNGYTSLYEIVDDLNNGASDKVYKTWGTVTKAFTGSNNSTNFYLQSSDKYSRIAGILVYNSPVAYEEGNVITLVGKPLLYDNIPEFLNPLPSDMTLDYAVNSSPVEVLETSNSFWKNSDDSLSNEFLNAQMMGARIVCVDNVTISYANNGTGAAYFADGTLVSLYYASVKNTTEINDYLVSLTGKLAKITGILHSKIKNGVAQLTLLLRDVSDITPQGSDGNEETKTELVINSSNASMSGRFPTGNYGTTYVNRYEFEYYRTVYSSGGFVDILPNFDNNLTTAAGAIYNLDPIVGIKNISITYQTSSSSGVDPIIEYGENNFSFSASLPLSTYTTTATYNVYNANYFKISTSESVLTLEEIVINYTNEASESTKFMSSSSGADEFRLNPITYVGTLYEGVSVDVPIEVIVDGNKVISNSYKTYTYYSTNYIYDNPRLADAASYVDPIDVANYYTIFKKAPANYVLKNNYLTAYNTFGENTRCVSYYTRTDGYATSVPYKADGTDKYGNPIPSYYELDIALSSSYSSSSRGVGRVVAWEYGFDPDKGAVNYDSSPVCVYTDDHYFSFQEYLNTGAFGKRFNAEGHFTSYIWGAATTLTL